MNSTFKAKNKNAMTTDVTVLGGLSEYHLTEVYRSSGGGVWMILVDQDYRQTLHD